MKNLNTLNLIALFTFFMVTSYAQSPRMVFVEEGTQASCPPCAIVNPPLQATLNQNTDKAVFIAYQVSWPGVDAMNEDNPTEVQERIQDYYDVGAVPDAIVQGMKAPGYDGPSYVTQGLIDQINGEMSEFDMTLDAVIENGILLVDGMVEATMPASGDLKLRIAILEKNIAQGDLAYPGTNGETEFHHVFKKFINGSAGITLATDWAVGDAYTIDETFDLSTLNIYDYEELEVVAFIQNDDNKFVHQAVEDSELEINFNLTNNATISNISGLPENVCRNEQAVSPVFNLQNNGNSELTSATIAYSVNGGTEQIYEWSGSLITSIKESVTLQAISFVSTADNTVNITVSAPNGEVDEYTIDNATSAQFTSLVASEGLVVEILTDDYADEVYWEIRNSTDEVVVFGGNPNVGTTNINTGIYPAPAHPDMYVNNTLYTVDVALNVNDCYTFHIADYYGDGMSFSTVPAYYRVTSGAGLLMVDGGNEIYAESLSDFQGDMSVGIEDVIAVNSINIFPNPAQNLATIDFNLIDRVDLAAINISNAIGQHVYTLDLGALGTGNHTQQIDLATLPNGLYLVQIELDNEMITRKITVAK